MAPELRFLSAMRDLLDAEIAESRQAGQRSDASTPAQPCSRELWKQELTEIRRLLDELLLRKRIEAA